MIWSQKQFQVYLSYVGKVKDRYCDINLLFYLCAFWNLTLWVYTNVGVLYSRKVSSNSRFMAYYLSKLLNLYLLFNYNELEKKRWYVKTVYRDLMQKQALLTSKFQSFINIFFYLRWLELPGITWYEIRFVQSTQKSTVRSITSDVLLEYLITYFTIPYYKEGNVSFPVNCTIWECLINELLLSDL